MIIRNRTSCHPIRSVIILVINQIRWPRILLITCMIADQIGLHSVLLPLLIIQVINKIGQQHSRSLICLITSMITDWIGQYNNKICDFSVAWENGRHFSTTPLVSLRNYIWATHAEIPYWWCITDQIWVVLLMGWKICFNQSEALPRSGYWWVISMEFLCLFLRRHFVGKPVVASWNVGCSLWQWCFKLFLNQNTRYSKSWQ